MPLPQDNKRFERGDLQGYTAAGLVFVERSFQDDFHNLYIPKDGQHFARLDDPYAVNFDGARTASAANQAVDTRPIKIQHADGQVTHGADGAYLEINSVEIPVGKSLLIHYAFIGYDVLPYNDFAVLHAYPNDNLNATPIQARMCEIRTLPNLATLRRGMSTDWQAFLWQQTNSSGNQVRFNGTVRIIMSNGQTRRTASSRPTNERYGKPSCLLIDLIDIV